MRIVLFCENKYAIDILHPLQEEIWNHPEKLDEILWYIHRPKIHIFPLKDKVHWTYSIQDIYNFSPEAIFVPGNIVPYYLAGVKIQIFHGYAAEKKDHWIIRRYFDTYFTQGPYFTKHFKILSERYKDFEVIETGWPKQDWIKKNLHSFDNEKESLLNRNHCKQIVLYAPTFSPSLTSLPFIKDALTKLVIEKNILLLLKLHPLTNEKWVKEYQTWSQQEKNIIFINDYNVTKYQLMSDIMISDTSSTVYEFLLLNKPVITYRTIAKDIYWENIIDLNDLNNAFEKVQTDSESIMRRKWIVENYDPYLDGNVCKRMLEAAQDYMNRHGVPTHRKLNLWRKYTSIKTFGRIKRK